MLIPGVLTMQSSQNGLSGVFPVADVGEQESQIAIASLLQWKHF
jgi:hypothetical protein